LHLLHSYYNFDYILKLPIVRTTKLLNKAVEEETENEMWDAWIALYPFMILGLLDAVEFKDFKSKLSNNRYRYTEKTLEEITQEMDKIIGEYKKKT
jgi:hypothetical protein